MLKVMTERSSNFWFTSQIATAMLGQDEAGGWNSILISLNPLTSQSVKQLIADGDKEELQKCFGARMEFGTAGLRAPMGAGVSRMNDLTIIQTTQGFCRYLEKQFSDLKQRGVVISFDARAHPPSGGSSRRFARLAATTFISQGIPVYLFSDITPTPFVPYAVSHLKLCAGIMITASHNPKQDNGYKVYWENGAQIISPHDKGISQAIEENLEPWPQAWDDSLIDSNLLLHNPTTSIHDTYFENLKQYCFHRNVNRETKVKFVHTSVHGVGHAFVQSAFKAFDLVPPEAVPEQKDPDPEFPTVKYPNPEEGQGVLTLSFALAEKTKAKIVLANDPDADRLAVAEKQDSGEWRVFSGNELGALLGWWLFTCWKEKKQDQGSLKDVYMLSSTVSSKILRAIALKEGFHFEETLTGFKWMGNRAKQLADQGKTVLFAFEEAIGYMCCPFVLDKDGVSAAVISAELASFLATKNLSLSQQLKAIYVEYGYHITKASYFICHDPETIKKLFENLRNYDGKNNYPKACGKFEISAIRDLTTGYDDSQPDKKAVLPTSKSSQMITFTFANGGVATMRTSGTEPKIKYYAELCAPPGNSDPEQLKRQLNELVNAIEEHFFQPQKYNLQPKAE
ncbi:phosphopentomutase isoform X1 [Ochotona princeps]|uniref:phosphopentomutase isoform X1 n=1 Tax=Ochotona princeps TaxID=9978 RepID=UPI002714CC63|nr:phosphopentomutase isoform X1 [Ochotona princeps]XP_058526204.1 phosphopentomutase isoform X1 [Ochotona princeps]